MTFLIAFIIAFLGIEFCIAEVVSVLIDRELPIGVVDNKTLIFYPLKTYHVACFTQLNTQRTVSRSARSN